MDPKSSEVKILKTNLDALKSSLVNTQTQLSFLNNQLDVLTKKLHDLAGSDATNTKAPGFFSRHKGKIIGAAVTTAVITAAYISYIIYCNYYYSEGTLPLLNTGIGYSNGTGFINLNHSGEPGCPGFGYSGLGNIINFPNETNFQSFTQLPEDWWAKTSPAQPLPPYGPVEAPAGWSESWMRVLGRQNFDEPISWKEWFWGKRFSGKK